jgi:hypothetical protein
MSERKIAGPLMVIERAINVQEDPEALDSPPHIPVSRVKTIWFPGKRASIALATSSGGAGRDLHQIQERSGAPSRDCIDASGIFTWRSTSGS